MSLPEFNGRDDRLPDSGLDKIDDLCRRLPSAWEIGNLQGHTKSVTVTIKFDDTVGPIAQAEACEDMLRAATVVGTLARNLRWERQQHEDWKRQALAAERSL